ncbi:MAG TPA: riboflavin synthase subunit alpha [Kaistia sp.]|jgi:riboflavin synthase|nr:riboflavin synthase subunit alpha [Kaistia sp.]
MRRARRRSAAADRSRLVYVVLHGLVVGASIAINGTCFTVTNVAKDAFSVDAVDATLQVTNIKFIQEGSRVNLERSSHLGAEVGGHVIAGHVAGMASILAFTKTHPGARIEIELLKDLGKYVFDKGFLAVNGASLTVASFDADSSRAGINLIPETLRMMNFADYSVGDALNIEIDSQTRTLVDTMEGVLDRLNIPSDRPRRSSSSFI